MKSYQDSNAEKKRETEVGVQKTRGIGVGCRNLHPPCQSEVQKREIETSRETEEERVERRSIPVQEKEKEVVPEEQH